MDEQKKEISQKIEAQVLLHKLQNTIDEIVCGGGEELLKTFQKMSLFDENFQLTKELSLENFTEFKKSKTYQQLQPLLQLLKNHTDMN